MRGFSALLALSILFVQPLVAFAAPPVSTEAEIEAALAAPDRAATDRERDARDHPAKTLGLLGLTRGMRVVDVFAGGGYYAEIAARAVGPTGSVRAHNNRAYLSFAGKDLEQRLAARPLAQLSRYDREVEQLDLAGEADAAILVMA